MNSTRLFLGFSVLVWMGYGAYCFFVPSVVSESAGLVASTPTAVTELRAMYGGLQLSLGTMAALALAREAWLRPAVFALTCVSIGLFSSRLIGAFIDSAFSQYTNGGLGFEFVSAAWAVSVMRKLD